MLAFFRRIRKSLLGSGQVQKYLFYSIGEIALVVIGILIALQINNWNENQKLRQYEIEILGEIRIGLLETKTEVTQAIEDDLRWRACNYKILSFLDERKDYDPSLDQCFGCYYWSSTAQFTTSAYDELKIKGLELISNPQLRKELTILFDSKFDVVKSEVEVWDSELLNSTIYPLHTQLFRKYFPKSWSVFEDEFAKPVNYENLFNNEPFKNLLSEIISLRNYSITVNQALEGDIQHLITSIDNELEVFNKN